MQKYIILLLLFTASSIFGFDREEVHKQRIGSIDLSARNVLNRQAQSASISTSEFSDIAVSHSVAPSKFRQDNSAIINLKDNGWLAAFDDDRLGSKKIFIQRFDSTGAVINSNQLTASSNIGSDFVDPILKTDSLGRVYLFFRNQTEGLIYGSRFNDDLTIDLTSFLVNDTTSASFAGPYDIDVYPGGKFVVVWENYSVLGSTIEMKLYNDQGIITYGPYTVNNDGGSVSHWEPSTAVDPTGNILVAWEDYRNGRADIYAHLFNGSGVSIGGEFTIVPPPSDASNQYSPEVIYTTSDEFVIGWIDQRQGQEIYLQAYSSSTGLIGSNIIVSPADSQFINWNLSLAVDNNQNLSAVWAAFGPQNLINLQKLTSGLVLVGTLVSVNDASVGRRWEPTICYNEQNKYAAVWSEFIIDHSDIIFSIYNENGSVLSEEQIVNDDTIGAVSSNPQAAVSTDWYSLIVFEDQRFDAGDIFIQTISNAGISLYSNIKVNQDIGSNLQAEPSLAASVSLAKSFVVWVDSRDVDAVPGQRIYGRVGTEFGLFNDDEFMISDSAETTVKKSPKTAIASTGKSLVVWVDKRDGSDQVYGQWIASDGLLSGNDFLISNPLLDSSIVDLQLTVDGSDNFYVIWLDNKLDTPLIKSRQYQLDGSAGLTFSRASSIPGLKMEELSAVVRANGNVVVLYSGININRRIYAAEYISSGVEITAPFEILDVSDIDGLNPAIAISNNEYFSVVWIDTRNGKKEAYYQILNNSLSMVGSNSPVSSVSSEFMLTPVTTAHNGRAWFSWADPRENGLNIYANAVVYLATDIDDNKIDDLPDEFQLMQNYPNPFNPTTEIYFHLSKQASINISIYNMLGQHVKTLVDHEYNAGAYSIIWDATNDSGHRVASGLYFYKMVTDNYIEMKKMILLK